MSDRDLRDWKLLHRPGIKLCRDADHEWQEQWPRAHSMQCIKCGAWKVRPWPVRTKPEEIDNAV
jgi:hypothetical protein